eukprot:CAMPEP_0172528202 /NCGR_PEP_ID=MMETSP1067-20121228/2665_1 /TAXON_ID=265564 ORGANISM="Thalassiosira punctigera, Strain Tpunct2005C2" /NCGR_SAMPLE_ID=MMETSP1067 /ASSEMBLY_ACC=CAM_ASM_000444 /LENGTH=104 /DNA_ID=CAMNT_0013312077 /DNA_START=561 /DNA_END=873 /DNA_ORIENTATION=-
MRGRHNYGLMSRWGEIGDLVEASWHFPIMSLKMDEAPWHSYHGRSMSMGEEGVAVGVRGCEERSAQCLSLIFIHPSTLVGSRDGATSSSSSDALRVAGGDAEHE